MDEVLHRSRSERAHGRHRARADDVRVDPRRPARVRAPKVVLAVDRDLCGSTTDEALEHLLARQGRIPVELGCEHLDARARGAQPDLAVDRGERAQEPFRVGSAGRAGHAEEDPHSPKATSWCPRGGGVWCATSTRAACGVLIAVAAGALWLLPGASAQSWLKLAGLYFLEPTANSSGYFGGGLSYGRQTFGGSYSPATSHYTTDWDGNGLQGELTAGYEIGRVTSLRIFVQADAIFPFYEATAETYSMATRFGPTTVSTDRRYAPSLIVSIGLGR